MKSVAVIGAGPGGLVTAKVLLRLYPGQFKVTVFDKQDQVGGLWAIDRTTNNKMLDPQMPTNLSKYTVSFSDLSWNSVDLSPLGRHTDSTSPSSAVPMFPRAWQVARYLETYRTRYIPNGIIHLNRTVTSLSRIEQGDMSKWLVEWTELSSQSQTEESVFDYAVVASGFCSSPLIPSLLENQNADQGVQKTTNIKHSSAVRSLSDLLPSDWDGIGDILVAGGTMSGIEAASTLAQEISNKRFAPGKSSFGEPKVIHVIPRPFYILRQFMPLDPSTRRPTFMPLDIGLYNLTRRPVDATRASFGRVAPEKAKTSHEFLRSKVGGDQTELNAASLVASSLEDAPYVAINTGSSYAEFVRAGLIVPMLGRVRDLAASPVANGSSQNSLTTIIATVKQNNEERKLSNIAGAVYATGYHPHVGLDFLSDDIKQKLEYDVESHRMPFILTDSQTGSDKLPGLAFVGVYEGAYWGVAESQARMIATKWASENQSSVDVAKKQHDSEQERAKLRDLRSAMHQKMADIPPLWNGDYAGLMEQAVADGYSSRDDDGWNGRNGPVLPARYTDSSCDAEEAKATLRDLQLTIERAANEGLFVAQAAFHAMQGSWTMRRELRSALSTSPSGLFLGTAVFEPRDVTDAGFDAEYLYIESGEFTTDQGFSVTASRRYVYRYNAENDQITTWFVKEDGKTVDYLFLTLAIPKNSERSSKKDYWVMTGHHPCHPDTYEAEYNLGFRGVALDKFVIRYKVDGPHKDYVSNTQYSR